MVSTLYSALNNVIEKDAASQTTRFREWKSHCRSVLERSVPQREHRQSLYPSFVGPVVVDLKAAVLYTELAVVAMFKLLYLRDA